MHFPYGLEKRELESFASKRGLKLGRDAFTQGIEDVPKRKGEEYAIDEDFESGLGR
jgi:hypothetical protein